MKIADHIPMPPDELRDPLPSLYRPGRDMATWIMETFVAGRGPLVNPDHADLEEAEIGILWTNETYEKKGRRVLGEARIGDPSGSNAWGVGRTRQQLKRWFGDVPDF